MKKDPRLGKVAKDKITGFKGIVTGKAEYLTGCTQLCLTPKVGESGGIIPSEWIDESRLEISGTGGIEASEVTGKENGGPNRDVPKFPENRIG